MDERSAFRDDLTLASVSRATREAYDLAADRYHELFHDELTGKPRDVALLDAIAGRLGPRALVLDAGCGPCGHIGRHLSDAGLRVNGVDISPRCTAMAREHNPDTTFQVADLASLPFRDRAFDAVLSYYSIIDTPSHLVDGIFLEFHRVLRPAGTLLVVVKAGSGEGWVDELLGIRVKLYFTTFTADGLAGWFSRAGLALDSLETRTPYEQEIEADRIYAIGHRPAD